MKRRETGCVWVDRQKDIWSSNVVHFSFFMAATMDNFFQRTLLRVWSDERARCFVQGNPLLLPSAFRNTRAEVLGLEWREKSPLDSWSLFRSSLDSVLSATALWMPAYWVANLFWTHGRAVSVSHSWPWPWPWVAQLVGACLLYTSDAADDPRVV